ncbi:hypothetical protein ANCDUO_09949, partial [Ancylostoma duodenale]
ELSMENGTLRNCTYRYSSDDSITSIALWIDGPCTCIAAILALIGVHFAVRFLFRAGLNKDLTAGELTIFDPCDQALNDVSPRERAESMQALKCSAIHLPALKH